MRSKLLRRHHAKVTAEWTKAGNQWWRANNVIYFTLRAGAFQALHLEDVGVSMRVCVCGVCHACTHTHACFTLHCQLADFTNKRHRYFGKMQDCPHMSPLALSTVHRCNKQKVFFF